MALLPWLSDALLYDLHWCRCRFKTSFFHWINQTLTSLSAQRFLEHFLSSFFSADLRLFLWNIISNMTRELNQHLSSAASAQHYKLHTSPPAFKEQTNSADSQNRSSSLQLRHQWSYWLSAISKWAPATRGGEEALGTEPSTRSNSIKLAWAQHFGSAAALCCPENWKILVMLLASRCCFPEADAVLCESQGTGKARYLAANISFFLSRILNFWSNDFHPIQTHTRWEVVHVFATVGTWFCVLL